MASEFLKQKAQQYSEQQNKGGNMPPSSENSSYESTKPSSFLQEKARAQAAYITEKFGDDAVGSTKWLSQDSALSDDTLSQLLNRIQSLPGTGLTPGTRRTSGGYYSLPSYGEDMKDLQDSISRLSPAMQSFGKPLETATSDLQRAQHNLQVTENYLQKARQAYDTNPSQKNADAYNRIAEFYNQAYAAYTGCYDTYNSEMEKYRGTADKVAAILDAYQKYSNQRQADYDTWRSSIRAAADIQTELDAVNDQIDQLRRQNPFGIKARMSAQLSELEKMKALLLEELDWSQHYRYSDLMQATDFAEKSRYMTTANGREAELNGLTGMYTETGFDDLTYDYINRNEAARGKSLVNSIADNTAMAGLDKTYLEKMTDEEIAVFNYLYATQGADAAYQYTAYLTRDLNKRQQMKQEAMWADWAREKPVQASAFSVLTSPMRGLSYLGQAAELAAGGEIDQNAAYNKFSHIPTTIRGEVSEKIEESGKWGSVGSFAYQTGMSMADFLFSTLASGGNSALAMTIMGSGAAADTTIAARERGVDSEKAFTLGAIAGLAEAVTEKYSIETLLDPKLLKDGTLKYVLKNMLVEGGEEGASDLINLFSDILIAGDQSQWRQSIDAYVAEGKTEKEAFLQAFKDQALTIGLDIVGGALSGGVLSGGNAAVQSYYNGRLSKQYDLKNVTENDAQEIINSGLESAHDTESYQLAVELQKKLDAGTIPTAEELSRQLMANEQAIQAEEAAEDAGLDGLQLPGLEDETSEVAAPREQNLNGGTQHERTQERNAGPAAAEGGARADVLHGGSQRYDGAGTGEQDGGLAGRTEQRRRDWTDRGRATVARQDYARSLRLEKVSSLDLGLQNGTEARNIQVMPQEHWDSEMSQLADRIYNETGKNVTYVMGRIQIRGTGGVVGYARGVITGDRIIVQADNLRLSMEQIADHEAYHAKVDWVRESGMNLNAEIRRHILETFTEEQFQQVLERYIVGLRGVIDVNEAKTAEEFEAAVRQIEEELFADAYAGVNAFGAGADQFTGAVNEKMDQLYMGKIRNQDNGTEEPTGPPSDRYSYAGENANNADLDALARAKEMQAAGVADETIRQQTGWHTGMDGKWRWEIDDSGMEYSGRGDLGLRERRPEYARYRELLDKANRHALELSDEALTPEETAELQKLKNIWGGTFRKSGRITEDALPTELLSDYVKHDSLFEAYPQLRKTRLRFADLPEGTRGQYDPEQDVITLSKKLRGKPQDTLIHEIQHVIQKAEGFAQGSSPEFWEQVQKGEQPVRANDRRVAEAERRIQEIMDSLPPFVAGQFELHRHLEKSDPDKAMELADALSEGPYGDEFSDFFLLTWDLDMAAGEDNYIRGAGDLYRNTAGEIEARDAASRRQLTAEQRRKTAPVRADDHTVFVEDVDDFSLQLGDRYSVDDADDQVAIGDLQAELYQLQHQRRSLLEADTAYAAAADNLRYANTFTEKVAARKAMAAAAANIDTAAIDQRISDLNEQISEIRNRETRQHREDQEKYSGTKTAGYSTMPDTRLKDLDQDYMKAVRSGDRARMAELVEQAAEAAMPASVVRDKSGRLLKTYHHTGNRFTVFDRNMARTGTEMDGFFFAPDPDSTSEYGSNMITAYLNITKLAMDPKLDRKFNDSGTLLREKLAYQGYDGMARTENGEIYEYMTFDPEQIKSADPVVYDDRGRVVPLSERFNFHNPDIRYSVDDEGTQQAQEQKPAVPKKKIRPVAESRPLIAKKDLRSTVLNLFSIPNGQRAEVGAMIDSYADRLIKNGSLTEDDRKAFFDRMYDAGVMVMPADEYSAYARSHIEDGRIYVSDSVKADFGDDWADIRRRAFAAGVYLVNDRSASGIDQWNATLSAEDMLPGLFDSEETDERTILERILQVAEEGKDEHLSLAEYTRRLSQQEGISEDEFLDNMERQLDWALRTFAEKARLEVHLRDRTGRKIAQEREKGAERMTRQQAKEAQRRADERQARKDSARRAKERRELRELQQRTLKQLQWLSRNRNRAPEELQATWDEVLGDIDLYAISAADEMRWSDKHNATWKDLAQMYKDAMKNDPNFLPSKELERIVTRLDATKIADMDLGALQDLYKAAIGLRTEFYNRNNVINDEMQRLFAEVYTDAKREIESAPGGFTGGVADKFLNMDQLTPMNVLQRMGGWDPDGAFYSMAKQLERGERDMRAYSVKAQRMLQDFLTEHEDWVKKADGQGKDGLWYKIEIPELVALELGKTPQFGGTIEVWMTPMQKIHMYLESKNQDNLRHMTGGRTFADKQIYSEGKRQEAFAQGKTVRMAPETVKAIVKDLTAEEMELAQILDRYYNTFATQEINKVSNILYGYDKAMGKNYAPIYTNRNYTKTEFGVFDTTAEGVGNLKGRQYAVNPSYNISAFDAFERHVDQTARFCGMAIPARNWTTLMNWREKNNSTGDVITHKWGEESKRYIADLITTLQAGDSTKTDTISAGITKLQSSYISAIFGANPGIVLKQLGSIPMAGAYLDARNVPTPAQLKNIDRGLISKYTQELEWRTMGYSTPETKQLKDNPNWTHSNKAFKFVFGGGAITAMDGWAAGTLWPWAENKVRREYPELEIGTKEQIDAGESPFYKKVAEEFENAITRSQSVSDEIHQGSLRKSKNPITKAFTMFRSDSAQTYNTLRQKIGEAQYYARTGAKDKVTRTAKKAVGTAFMAMLINAAWGEAINFLMALWKNRGKYYRDDEDELTFESVAGEMVSGMVGSFAGVVTGGEEILEIIGNILTGEKIYDIETPGMEQLNDLIDTVTTACGDMRELVAAGWDVLKNGGNLGDYFGKHSGQILGNIKDLAEAAAMYLPGLPASNLEAYLIGALKWISPELGAAYDDLFSDAGKNDLAGMEGAALEGRVGRILSDRKASESEETAKALTALYEAGYKTAIPSDTPPSVSIKGEKHSLGAYQQQAYDTIWGGIVADALDDLVASDNFASADPEARAKMLSNLYTYAAEQAKAELFDEYELDSGAKTIDQLKASGLDLTDCIAWTSEISGMKQGEKFAALREWDMSDDAKRAVMGSIIGTDMETESGKPSQYAKMLDALSKGLTVDQYLDMRLMGTDVEDYLDLIEEGMDADLAYDFSNYLEDIEAAADSADLDDLTRWRASVDFSDDVENQLAALSMVMTESQMIGVEVGNNFGIVPDLYVKFYEVRGQYDADGNGSFKQAEVKEVIDAQFGHLSKEQKAALWQLMNSSTRSAKNNPYSQEIGQKVLDAKEAAKNASLEEEELEGLKLGSW